MFGYPRRHQPQRRVAPVTTLFDPSGDAACTGWWRVDANLNISNDGRGLATGLTSRLPDQKPLVNGASPPWLVVPQASNGFPGLMVQNEGWAANGIAVSGDRYITATWVLRFLSYKANFQETIAGVGNMCAFGCWDSYIRLYHPFIGWWNVNDGVWFPWNSSANIWVLTMRVKPIDEAGGNLAGQFRFNANTSAVGPFNQTGAQGDRIMTEAHQIFVNGTTKGPILFHELLFFRRHLSDAEVISMHDLLLLQYGQAV